MKHSLLMTTAASALLMGGISVPAFAADAQGTAQASQDKTGTSIGDIVVTATRRSEKMQNVPLTLEAIGSEQLKAQGITNFDQLLANLPEVHAGGRGPGQNAVSIRGLSLSQISLQASAVAGPDPTVAIYIDDASVALPGRNLDVYVADIERVEVLEGPQGTLFGASAEGGAIRYITNKPNLTKFQAGMTLNGAATPGHAMSESGQGYLNVPIIQDKLAIRAAVFVDHQGGYIDNVYGTFQMPLQGNNADGTAAFCLPGAPATPQCIALLGAAGAAANAAQAPAVRPTIDNAAYVKNDFNPANYAGGRVSVKWAPAPDWTVNVEDMFQTLDAEGVFMYDPTLGDLKVQRFSPDYNDDKFNQIQWAVDGKLGKLGVVYTGSYLDRRVAQKFDYTKYAQVGPYAPYYICHYPGYATCATPRMTYIDNERNTRLTQEFRVTTPSDLPYRLQAGVYYDNTKLYEDNTWFYEGAASEGFIGRPPGGVVQVDPSVRPAGGVYFNDAIRSESQFAFFGEANWDITSQLTLTGGARHYSETLGLEGSVNCGSLSPTPGPHVCGSGNYGVSLAGKSPAHQSGTTPKVTLSYKPERGVMVYATYSQGFRPGGFNRRGGATNDPNFNIPFTYGSDSVKNYEVGWKLQFANNSIRWNGAAYWIDWNNIPIAIYAPAVSNSTFDLNGPNARVKGITSDLMWRATHELTLTGNLTYNDAKLVSYGAYPAGFIPQPGDSATALTSVPIGSPLALAPKWQGNMRARYEHEMASGSTFFGQLGAQFVGSSYTQTIKTYNQKLAAYTMMDTSMGVKKDGWSMELYVNNLTDKRAELYKDQGDNVLLTSTARPRTIGMRMNWAY